jgi:hypothetical protein
MYYPTDITHLAKLFFIFALLHDFFKAAKQVKDVTDNNQKNVIRNCGMWALELASSISERKSTCPVALYFFFRCTE